MVDNDSRPSDAVGDTREQGIEFGQLKEQLQSHDYPTTGEEILASYGNTELGLPNGTTTVREILGKRESVAGSTEDLRYESAEEVHQSIFNMIGSDAVGREKYSDRGATHLDDLSDGETRDYKSL